MPRLIFFCGHAGTGKTTLARRTIAALMAEAHVQCTGESFCLLDKDTLYGDYSSAVMGVLTGDPNDRDSPPYLQHLRNPEYHGLKKTARENLGLGVSTIVVDYLQLMSGSSSDGENRATASATARPSRRACRCCTRPTCPACGKTSSCATGASWPTRWSS